RRGRRVVGIIPRSGDAEEVVACRRRLEGQLRIAAELIIRGVLSTCGVEQAQQTLQPTAARLSTDGRLNAIARVEVQAEQLNLVALREETRGVCGPEIGERQRRGGLERIAVQQRTVLQAFQRRTAKGSAPARHEQRSPPGPRQ